MALLASIQSFCQTLYFHQHVFKIQKGSIDGCRTVKFGMVNIKEFFFFIYTYSRISTSSNTTFCQ